LPVFPVVTLKTAPCVEKIAAERQSQTDGAQRDWVTEQASSLVLRDHCPMHSSSGPFRFTAYPDLLVVIQDVVKVWDGLALDEDRK